MFKLTIAKKQAYKVANLLLIIGIVLLMNTQRTAAQLEGTATGGTIVFGSSPLQGF